MTDSLLDRFSDALEEAGGRFVRAGPGDDPGDWAEREYPGATVGIDAADLLIAETGTVARSYPDREAARVSLDPEVTVFTATGDEVVADLPEALERIAPAHRESRAYTVLVTGPSRTADIEKTLVVPAHGPRQVIVWLTGDAHAHS